MDFNNLYKSHDVHNWHNYLPQEKHYANFEPYIIYSLQKVDDVYSAFSNARYNAYMTENEDYGQMVSDSDESSLIMLRSNFFVNALNFYNFAIDLSWQVLFFYTSDNSLYFLSSPNSYDKYSNLCNYETLVNKLRYRRELRLLQISNTFYSNNLVRELRELYNYLKHRGTLHFEGLGEQFGSPYMSVKIGKEDITYNMFVKRNISIDELKNKLKDFDILFYEYFNNILSCIVPRNYLEIGDDFTDVLNVSMKIKQFKEKELTLYDELFNQFYYDK